MKRTNGVDKIPPDELGFITSVLVTLSAMAEKATDEEMNRIHPTQLDYVTMAVTVDVSDLAAPRVNYLLDKADTFESEFQEVVADMRRKKATDEE